MRIYKSTIIELYYYFLLSLILGIYLILPLKLDTLRNYLTIFSLVILVIFFPLYLKNIKKFTVFTNTYFFGIVLTLFYGIYLGNSKYSYDFKDIFYGSRQYIWILLFCPLLATINNREFKYYKVLNNIINLLLLSLGLRTISWLAYSFFKIVIFPGFLYEYGDLWYRNETSIRIDGTPLITIGILSALYLYLKLGESKYLYKTIAILLYIILVNQTRILLISVILGMAVLIIFSKRINSIFKMLLAIPSLIVLYLIMRFLINYLGLTSDAIDYGIGYRYWELDYYLQLISDGEWVRGLGILVSINPFSNIVLYGTSEVNRWYLDALGFIELFVQFGLVSIPMYGILLYKLLNLYNNKYIDKIDKAFMLSLFWVILITSISLNIYGIQRSFSLSVIVMIMCYLDKLSKRKEISKNGS